MFYAFYTVDGQTDKQFEFKKGFLYSTMLKNALKNKIEFIYTVIKKLRIYIFVYSKMYKPLQ